MFDNRSRYIGPIESHTASVVSMMKKQLAQPRPGPGLPGKCNLSTAALVNIYNIHIVMLDTQWAVGINLLYEV